jgi:hypothetical protein
MISIVVPVGLLTTFRLTGILNGPATISETITLETIQWEFERPTFLVDFMDNVEGSYNNEISINQSIFIYHYIPESWYGGSHALQLNLSLSAVLEEGYLENINVTFLDAFLESSVTIPDLKFGGKNDTDAVWDNLAATAYRDWLQGVEKAFVNLKGVNYPRTVYLRLSPAWILRSPHNQTQQLTVRVEVTYFNGTLYKKAVQSFQLKLVADVNNSFETAEEISSGESERHFLGGGDRQDFYKIYLTNGETINVTMLPPVGSDFDLFLYDPVDKINSVANSTYEPNVIEHIEYTVDSAGWWFIEVWNSGGGGIYTLTLTASA